MPGSAEGGTDRARGRGARTGRVGRLAAGALALALAASGIGLAPSSAAASLPAATRIASLPPLGLPPLAGAQALQARLGATGPLIVAGERLNRPLLVRFYAAHGYETIWGGHPEAASALVRAVLGAGAEGLDPAAFHGALLSMLSSSLSPADRDLLLSDAFLGYAGALARGGMPPAERPANEALAAPPVDVAALAERALATRYPVRLLAALAPDAAEYRALRRGYAHYLAIARDGGWPRVPAGPKLAPGAIDRRMAVLQKRLAAEGYLPPGYASEGHYDRTTAAALSRFQAAHGLAADGVLGPETLAELDIDAGSRAQQVAVNLERLRWLPRPLPADRIEVDTASATLELFRDDNPVFETRVVVGAVDKQTPEFQAAVDEVLFNPPWYVPYSIAQKEILPRLADDPDYLSRHRMRFWKASAIEQLPGPHAALGQLKFVMADAFDVYLHDTPDKWLFRRENRRLSHGCVRVENPRALAALLLGADAAEIGKEIARGATHGRRLPRKLPVFVLYRTAVAGPGGAIEFRPDWYRRDEAIRRYLHPAPAQRRNLVAGSPPSKG